MHPFLLLATRPEDDVARQEYEAFLEFGGLAPEQMVWIRVQDESRTTSLADLDLTDFSGIFLGGSPFNVTDPESGKSSAQQRAESELGELARRVVAADFPFLGACYGVGILGPLLGGVVDRTHGEPAGVLPISLTTEGVADPLFGVLAPVFEACLGHKEAVSRLPDGAVVLASSATCPVHAFRLGRHVYATQFHPEMDGPGLCDRIDAYSSHGYYEPHEQEPIKQRARTANVTDPPLLIARFVELYGRDQSP